MVNAIAKHQDFLNIKTILLDFVFLISVYFTPAMTHTLGLPIYLLEPMRIMLILSIAHTNKFNTYVLAIILPMVSFLFSGHPVFPKVILVMIEFVINISLFFAILNLIGKNFIINNAKIGFINFIAMLLSIIISKVIYYLSKYLLISLFANDWELFSTPVYIQLILTFILSLYIWFIASKSLKTQNYL